MDIKIAPHQEEFAKTCRPYELLAWGTGCGKSLGALYAMSNHTHDILVIAPKTSVQKGQWVFEAKRLGIKEPTVISKETFRRDHKILRRYEGIIIDEIHNHAGIYPNTKQKNKVPVLKTSQLCEATYWYLQTHRPKRFIGCSATPNKSPLAIFAIGLFAGKWGARVMDYFYNFRHDFYTILPMNLPFGQQVYTPKRDKTTMDRIASLTKSIGQVLRLEDIKEVPPQIFITKEFDLTKGQQDALKTLTTRFTGDSTLRLKRHQIENGLLYEDVFDPSASKVVRKVERFSNEKLDYIIERSYEFKKMVVFANYTEQVDMIAEALRSEGKNVFILDSRTKDRKQVCDDAESADSAYIVAQASVSSEWEFKSCPCVIFASLDNKNLSYIQGLGRVQRYDAVKKNLYIHLVTNYKGSVDKKWYDCIMSGKDFNEALFV